MTLVATATAFVMATAVPGAFGDDGLWFAIPYVVVRVLGLGLQVRVDSEIDGSDRSGLRRWVALSSVGLALVLVGAVASPDLRPFVWGLAIVADVFAAARAGSRETWELDPAHLAERHGLIVIIALGESVIVAGAGVIGEPRSPGAHRGGRRGTGRGVPPVVDLLRLAEGRPRARLRGGRSSAGTGCSHAMSTASPTSR